MARSDYAAEINQIKRAEYEYCKTDLVYWAKNYGYIEDKDAPEIIVPFNPWPEQLRVLNELQDNRLNIILKARQLGITWLALHYCGHDLMFNLGHTVVALSKTEVDAFELVRRMKVILSAQTALMEGGGLTWKATATTITITDGKLSSTFKSFSSSPSAGRSFTANILLLDEWAFQEYAEEIWDSAFPTINRPNGGKVIGLSTIKLGTLFSNIWESGTAFHKIFLGVFADPRRTKEWYEETKKALGVKIKQEYPKTAEEAMSNLGGAFFHEFDYELHTVEPFEIQDDWRVYEAMDYGLDKLAHYKVAVDNNNNCYVFHELYESDLIVSAAADKIKQCSERIDAFGDMEEWQSPYLRLAPPDLWQTNSITGRSIADMFDENGVELTQASNRREDGWLAVKELLKLRPQEDGIMRPRLRIFRTCTNLIRTMQQILIDEKRPNDCAREPHELTHAPDALRYFAIYWVEPNAPVEKVRVKYTPDMLEDYRNASASEREYLEKKYGVPEQ